MFIGVYMIMVFDPQILFNDGFYDIIHVTLPKGSLLHPNFPAPLGSRTHALARQFDVLGGALSRNAPEMATAAGVRIESALPLFRNGCGGPSLPAHGDPLRRDPRPAGRRRHGRALVVAAVREHPFRVPRELLPDAHRGVPLDPGYRRGGPASGRQRGGEGLPAPRGRRGLDPRRPSPSAGPWGILGGRPGACSEKWLVRDDGSREKLPSKVDNVRVAPGDRIGLSGPRAEAAGAMPSSANRRSCAVTWCGGLLTAEAARDGYGGRARAVRGARVDHAATDDLRARLRRERGTLPTSTSAFGRRRGPDAGPRRGHHRRGHRFGRGAIAPPRRATARSRTRINPWKPSSPSSCWRSSSSRSST